MISGINYDNNVQRKTDRFAFLQTSPIVQNFKILQNGFRLNNLENDIFEKQSSPELSFTGQVKFTTNEFKKRFNKSFFKKLMRENIRDAYTDKPMVSQEDIDTLKSLGVFRKKSSIAIKYLKEYEEGMYPIEKEIFYILKNLSKKHPDMNLQELLQLKFKRAEELLIQQQTKILDKISMMVRGLPRNEYLRVRKFINEAFDKILDPHPTPEGRFSRKIFLHELNELPVSNPKTKDKIMAVASKLPSSSDSINAFIVKYSHSSKITNKTPFGKQEIVITPRSPEEIALKLLDSSVQSDEHIFPQAEFRKLEEGIQNGTINPDDVSTLRVSILTSKYINNKKTNILIDDFIKQTTEYNIPENLQKHANQLLEVMEKWERAGRFDDAATLGEYIKVLQEEFIRRSDIVRIDIGDIDPKIAKLREKAKISLQKRIEKKQKRAANASNNHGEANFDKNGNHLENRKFHVHSSKFNQ